MPFIDSAQSLKARLHLSEASTPVLVGIVALALIAIVLVCQNIIGAYSGAGFSVSHESSASSSSVSQQADGSEASNQAPAKTVTVFVAGAVAAPGVYTLNEGARVQDAVAAAGGFAADAATQALNLARVVADGEQITIVTQDSLSASNAPSPAGKTQTPTSNTATQLVNINTASAAELETLPGVGAVTAQKIVANRTDEGPFLKIDDLKRVSGIGEKKYAALADFITV